ncbi:MAG: hypothetical protein SNJ73_06435 [Acetobacteraceae bacterium]
MAPSQGRNGQAEAAALKWLAHGWGVAETALLSLGTAHVPDRRRTLPPPSDDVARKLRRLGAEIGTLLRAMPKEPPNSLPRRA